MSVLRLLFLLSILSLAVLVAPATAEYVQVPESSHDPSILRIDETSFLGAKVRGDFLLSDGAGREFTLESRIDSKPLILVFSYYECDGVCPTVNATMKEMLSSIEGHVPGRDFSVLTLSFDKTDDALEMGMFEEKVGFPGPLEGAWKVAIMKNPEEIEELTKSVGFNFFWSNTDKVFAHPNVFIILTADGRVSRYLYGAQMQKKDLGIAIAEAGFGKTGRSKIKDLTDLYLIACYSYNFEEGSYTINYPFFIGAGSFFLSAGAIVISILVFKKRARR
jgi:protein SCO1/2